MKKKQFIFEAQSIEFQKKITEELKPPVGGEDIDFSNYCKGLLKAYKDLEKKLDLIINDEGDSRSYGKISYNFLERNLAN